MEVEKDDEIDKLIEEAKMELQKVNNVNDISDLIKLISLTDDNELSKNVCLKPIKNQGAWRCSCQKNKESIYCNDCWKGENGIKKKTYRKKA